ncbi:alpha/beta hydrolase fold domain-containing protein [Nocardia fusca]|uniref:alpha/beta hydrolase fold domain-containing protein n=1 Tax=Nocardia fusca TaxID=941183 RepID=UPI0037C623B1
MITGLAARYRDYRLFHTDIAAQPSVDPTRIVIAGASAGGLAAALAIRARDTGPVQPILQLLLYPMLDDRPAPTTGPYRVWGPRSNAFAWNSYLHGTAPALAVPARHHDLNALAPAWIAVGTHDILYRQDLDYHHALTAAGTPSTLTTLDGAFHGFDTIAPRTALARRLRAWFYRLSVTSLIGECWRRSGSGDVRIGEF